MSNKFIVTGDHEIAMDSYCHKRNVTKYWDVICTERKNTVKWN